MKTELYIVWFKDRTSETRYAGYVRAKNARQAITKLKVPLSRVDKVMRWDAGARKYLEDTSIFAMRSARRKKFLQFGIVKRKRPRGEAPAKK